jgi:hypothetical protein
MEMIGLALGGYDVNRKADVFSRQMDFFFGPNSTDRIDYEVFELGRDVPLVIYNITGTTVFAFRGFASSSELAVQVERLASLWVVPFFLEMLPLYETIRNRYLSFFTPGAYLLGWHWFSPRSASDDLLQRASEIYDDMEIDASARVIFVGINSGGTIAKRLALLKSRRGVSFLSPPIDLDEFDNRYDFDDTAKQWATNVVNVDGLFSGADLGSGENFELVGDPDVIGRDKVYASFCNLAYLCGHSSQFGEYCKAVIGEEEWEVIEKYYSSYTFTYSGAKFTPISGE